VKSKTLKSQWEFGELFPAEAVRKTLTVSELTGSIRRVLEKEVGSVSVMGEITNLRVQPSGHIYFTLKDAVSQIACVLFRNESRAIHREYLTDGQKVVIEGTVTVYETRGQYQLQVFSVQLQGQGALQAAFERLKQKLAAEGLFDPARKKPLPPYPQRIGLVTSPAGAAIRDILHTIARRNPALEIILAPCRVQGTGAAQEIAEALRLLNEWAAAQSPPSLDLIVLTRGGGSLEDLWAFNDEAVARAIASSRLPVVSAVGHEIDFTISDFAADFRAATPTAAAEIITEGAFSARSSLPEVRARLRGLAAAGLEKKQAEFRQILRRLQRMHPKRRFADRSQKLDELQAALVRSASVQLRHKVQVWHHLRSRMLRVRPQAVIAGRRERAALLALHLRQGLARQLLCLRERASRAEARLRLLSPQNVLNRGYSITLDARTGAVIRDAQQAKPGAAIRSRLARGEISSVVTGS